MDKFQEDKFIVKDSGKRQQYKGGMVRDVAENKVDYSLIFDGPLVDRYATHLTKGAVKYSKRNWMKADGDEELERFRESSVRHFRQWLRGDIDEDHFSATVFNMNCYEHLNAKLKNK